MDFNWFNIVTEQTETEVDPIDRRQKSDLEIDLAIWKDMMENPSMYGDDILEWMELDESLSKSAARWRLSAYWLRKEKEANAKEEAEQEHWKNVFRSVAVEAANVATKRWLDRDILKFTTRIHNAVVKIQSAVRGYLVRCRDPHMNCCMCLARVFSPLKTDVGMMCRECGADGPYKDVMERDPWDWFRAEYVDMTELPLCRWCLVPMDEGQTTFCDHDCEYEYNKELYNTSRW